MRLDAAQLPVWSASLLGDLLVTLARAGGLPCRHTSAPNPPEGIAGDAQLDAWFEATAEWLGLELEPTILSYAALPERLPALAPALVRLPAGGCLALAQRSKLLAPDHKLHEVPPEMIRSAACGDLETSAREEAERLLDQTGLRGKRREFAAQALVSERLRNIAPVVVWSLRTGPAGGFGRLARGANLAGRLTVLCLLQFVELFLSILSWWVIGLGVMQGRIDTGWLAAWVLLLATTVPLRTLITWGQSGMAIAAGGLLKERLLYGTLRLEPDEIRHQGAGQLLARVMESDAIESLALSGGFLVLAAIIDLVLAGAILAVGAGGLLHFLLLVVWTGLLVLLSWSYFRGARHWTESRLSMTHDLVERMVGHRTRLAQEAPHRWHEGEDQTLQQYLEDSADMDRRGMRLLAFAPRGWLILGILGLGPAFVFSTSSISAVAVGLGGILLAYRAIRRLAFGMWSLAGAAIAWDQVAAIFRAAEKSPAAGSPDTITQRGTGRTGAIIDARDLTFRYGNRPQPVLRGCSVRVGYGDRLILEGSSGGGKSTLTSLLAGLRRPESGLLLLGGLDRQALGENGWRRLVAAAPQFHENHVFSGSFAFNLLMGRQKPIQEDDLRAAEAVCQELGLADLLARMPAGLLQWVGESGWQLSHGECSRLYIARALLQDAEVILLDESFAALDPDNLRQTLECVLKRARTVVLIAHR